jgi:tetratricopeptide (TPR) repeat protein
VTAAALALCVLASFADGGAPEVVPAAASAARPAAPAPAPAEAGGAPLLPSPATRAGARTDHALGLQRLRAGKTDEAAALFARAVAGDPGNAVFATDLGFALGRLGRRAEAEAALRGAIEKDPRRFYAYANLADLLADDPARWDHREAIIAELERGLGALKDDRKGRFNLLLRVANFERAVGRTAAARARLEPLLGADATPALTPAQRKRVLDLLDAVTLDERAQALDPWPAPAASSGARDRLAQAEGALAAGRADDARAAAEAILRELPTWQRAHVVRARALEAAGRVDDAASELEIAVNLAPSDAEAWRALGRLLALHGGALEAERADEALRNALALEPAWTDLRELRAEVAHRRAGLAAAAPAPRAALPSDRARSLFQEAEEWIDVGDPAGLGGDLLDQALADSPGYVAAAVTAYSLRGAVPEASVKALWDDGAGLWALVTGVRRVAGARGGDKSDKGEKAEKAEKADKAAFLDGQLRPWIDRAVELDVQEARFARAVARAAANDREGALDDLVSYVAREPRPAHLAEARALRAGLTSPGGRPSPELLARIRLFEDRPDAALRALGGSCADPRAPADRLLALGRVYEYAGRLPEARGCYEAAVSRAPRDEAAATRLARLDARLPAEALGAARLEPIVAAEARGVAAASWVRARALAATGDTPGALAEVERALRAAGERPDDADVWVPAAREARARWAAEGRALAAAATTRRKRLVAATLGLLGLGLVLALRRRLGGFTLEAAVRRQPALFPEVARVVGELRHDVLKHRAGALGLAADPKVARADLARALLEPRPTSAVVAAAHAELAQAARGQGLELRPLAREPSLGPLAADLARAERLLAGSAAATDALLAIDRRLRGAHADRLAVLLAEGPRTRLGAQELADWIAAVEAAARGEGAAWIAPALMLRELDVDFPVERDALHAIFANLLRNAQAAAGGAREGRVIVRVERERDVTGRNVASLLVGDSAAATLTLEAVEGRESGRGLAIVRDLVRKWRGHVVIRDEPPPFAKVVGACFPL